MECLWLYSELFNKSFSFAKIFPLLLFCFFTHVIHNYVCPKYFHHLVFSFKCPGETFWMLFTNFYLLLPEPKSVSSMSRWKLPFPLGPAANIPLGLLFMVLISACLCTAMFLWCYMAILWKEKLNSDRAGGQSWTEKLGIALRGWAAALSKLSASVSHESFRPLHSDHWCNFWQSWEEFFISTLKEAAIFIHAQITLCSSSKYRLCRNLPSRLTIMF